jgi:maltose alpha-D-glucosyltransferase / alpha-amylase
MPSRDDLNVENDPFWYKDAIIYEVHVRAFHDSANDGMGDFRGLTRKLDYLQDLGVTAIWLLPFSPSPWRDDGYDIADYNDVHPAYGTLRDFQSFLKEAHRRGLRVITEVVINHTSDQHEWFQRSRRAAPGTKWRDFYVWSDNPEKYKDARIIFKDFETSNWTWDPIAGAHYWHRFYSHQPDLNFDNPAVRQAVLDVVDFWFDMGVDAFRLDAIPYLFEREGTNCENLPETHEFLKQLRAHVDAKHTNRMLLAEANQWPEDSVAYFGAGDECHMCFHFPVMPRMFMAIRMEDRYPVIDILNHTPAIPANCQWALFLRNHDELTLEMVTDEERDYMYRVYAHDRQMRINLGIRRRLAPLLGNDRRSIELMNALLFSLPGTPVVYYGDEIGMGDNIYLGDRNGVRTPMQWSADRNAGFSRSSPQKLYLPITSDPEYHYETINVEAQQANPNSLLWWTKRIIEQRKQYKAFGRGTIRFLHPDNRRVLAFHRQYERENILVVANLSRFPQHVSLDLSDCKGMVPVEMFGRAEFPVIADQPYIITLGGHSFYWFSLETRQTARESIDASTDGHSVPIVPISSWDRLLDDRTIAGLSRLLPSFLLTRRWYRGKARVLRRVQVRDIIPIGDSKAYVVIIEVEYADGDPDLYVLPVALAQGVDEVRHVEQQHADTIVARLRTDNTGEGVLYGALWYPRFRDVLLGAIARRRRFRGHAGELIGTHTRQFRHVWGGSQANLESTISTAEQSNSSILYGDRFIMKLFRKIEPGVHPDIEVGMYLTAKAFPHTPAVTGAIEYRADDGEAMQVAILQAFVPNQGDAWNYTLDALSRFFEIALAGAAPPGEQRSPLDLIGEPPPAEAQELIGAYLESARLLGQRTAEMHAALSDPLSGPDFAPEPFTQHYRHGLYHGMMSQANRSLQLLRQRVQHLTEPAQADAKMVLEREDDIRGSFRPLRDRRLESVRIRHHGDYHLGQLLYTGKDFQIIDFEGEPARPLSERRLKRSPVRDVAGMVRSFQYSAYAALYGQIAGVTPRPELTQVLERFADYWTTWVSAAFLRGYVDTAGGGKFLPPIEDFRELLNIFTLEKALYEVAYELNNRPDWVRIPLTGMLKLLESRESQ